MNAKKCKKLRKIVKTTRPEMEWVQYEKQEYVGRVGGSPYLSARKLLKNSPREVYQFLKRSAPK